MPEQIVDDMSDTDDPNVIPPLTRNGYTRLPPTIADILGLLGADRPTLLAAFAEDGEGRPGYRTAEAMVFFIRQSHRNGNARCRDALIGLLTKRCQIYFRGTAKGFDQEARQDIHNDVLADMIRLLLDKTDAGDFLESHFWVYLQRKTLTAVRRAKDKRYRAPLMADLGETGGEEADLLLAQQHEQLFAAEDREKVREGLAILSDYQRELVILRYFEDWQIGNERRKVAGPSKPTLAERFNCSTKTIHNHLTEAKKLLKAHWKDEQ